MKKILIVSIFDNNNFGTYLQTTALGITLVNMGHEVEVLRYTRKSESSSCHFYDSIKKESSLRKKIAQVFRSFVFFYYRKKKQKFVKMYLPVTRSFSSLIEIVNNVPQADIYLIGSDQVWNSVYNKGIDPVFYLSFIIGKKKCSYAASIGMNVFSPRERIEIANLLSDFNHISVRELQAKQLLESIGVVNVEVVLDPTLLLDREKWLSLVDHSLFKSHVPYLLIYSVEYDDRQDIIREIAVKIAKNMNLKIYRINNGYPLQSPTYIDKEFSGKDVAMFLHLFAEASYTIVSSFHGTAFSINMNKDFVTVSPNKYNSRIDSLLEILGLEGRRISKLEDWSDDLMTPIDYVIINEIIDEERFLSMNYLHEILK